MVQHGRRYPQVIDRWTSPDEDWHFFAPLKGVFNLHVLQGVIPLDLSGNGINAVVDTDTGEITYTWDVNTFAGTWHMQFLQALLAPLFPRVGWRWTILSPVGGAWVGVLPSNGTNTPWGAPFGGAVSFIPASLTDTLVDGHVTLTTTSCTFYH